jgi:soluble lytic murein transglycosylase-like protein
MALMKRFVIIIFALILPATASGFCFEDAGNEYGVSPLILWSISQHESAMNPAAICRNVNGTYDYGLMQINSSWAKVLGTGHWMKLGDPCTNVRTGAWILAQCVRRHGYNWKAVGCYHSNTPGRRERYAGRIASIIAAKTTLRLSSRLVPWNVSPKPPDPLSGKREPEPGSM